MLEAACDKAQAVVLDQVFFSLDVEKFKKFTTMLGAPFNGKCSALAGQEASARREGRPP
jgi:uncharacterized protein (DUF1778 family)